VQHRLLTFSLPYLGKVLLGSRPRTLGEYQRGDRSNYLIGLASIGFGLLISVMFDTCFHLIIFTVAGGCAGIFDSKIHRFGCGLFAICEQLIGSITIFATKSLASQKEP
jgi:hypothetical protein